MKATEVQVNYSFGSLANLKGLVQDGFQPVRRREPGRRYCRFCGKLLPGHRWFFCDPPNVEDNVEDKRIFSCQEKYLDLDDGLGEEWVDGGDQAERKPLAVCSECPETCKVKIPVEQDEAKLTFTLACKKVGGLDKKTGGIDGPQN
jgi:hypothetical protein